MLTQLIRRQFLDYFKKNQHSVIPSSSVVPHDDPTLLFNNAGMNQFKDVFLGKTKQDYVRAATSQKCIRVGGKHNDLENVGHTSRHLTFFEMLGNFSFGNYFKEDAIRFAWEVSTEIFQFDPHHIWPTVFKEDDEAFELWTKYVPAERITRLGEKDNFWAMGDTGPCGPCSELLYDRGAQFGTCRNPAEDQTGERFLEFWNLVFMQYNRQLSGVKDSLPKPSIDTGAGLERVVSLKMGVDSVFETDVLRNLIEKIEEVSGVPYNFHNERAPAFRVIADHLRCLAFAIADGAQPSNTDRGYVLRKILRRAVRYGRQLGMNDPFLAKILPRLTEVMGEDYIELIQAQARIADILTVEEESFIRTLRRGGTLLNQVIEESQKGGKIISGADAFKLKDTYGLPIEEILLIAKDSHLTVDETKYQLLEEQAKERSRTTQKTTQQIASESVFADFVIKHGETKFIGYKETCTVGRVIGLFINGHFQAELLEGQEGLIILDTTPFYAEMGGQVGDIGFIKNEKTHFNVTDTIAPFKGLIAHQGTLDKGTLYLGDSVQAEIHTDRRQKISNNHTATHLLHWALHQILGEHVKQAGSVVDPSRLRFDFSHHKALTAQEIRQIESLVNAKIRENRWVKDYELPYQDVLKRADIKQFFGEKYGYLVRVIDMESSKELCGGTHTSSTGTIGLFRITKESSIAAGVRRIEAATGEEAEMFALSAEDQLLNLSTLLKSQPHLLNERVEKLLEEHKSLMAEVKNFKKNEMLGWVDQFVSKMEVINNHSFIAQQLPLSIGELKESVDLTLNKIGSGIVLLAVSEPNKCHILIKISDDLVKKNLSAHELIKIAAPIIDGSGGGKANSAQAGGKYPEKLNEAIDAVRNYLKGIKNS
jgi:alanyl-tRNA synthetase